VKPVQDVPEGALATRTETTYSGPFIIGRDLMSFVIGDKIEAFDAGGHPSTPLSAQR
jgi:ribonuclease Z